MKIANKISISFFAIMLLLVSFTASIFYIVAKDYLKKAIFNNLSTAAVSRANHIETYLKMLQVSIGQLSKSVVLENFLKINGKEDFRRGEAFEMAMKRLKRTKEVNPSISEFMLLDATGKIVASNNESILGVDKSTDAYFLGGQKGAYIKNAYFSETEKMPLMAVSAPITESQTGEFLGVLVARVRLDELNAIVTERTGLGETGEIYIVNKYGFMITPSSFKVDTFLKQRVDTENMRKIRLHKGKEHLLPKKKMENVFSNYLGAQVMGTHEYIPQMKWGVLAEVSTKEAFAPLAKLRLIFVMILLIAPILSWLLGIYIARLITDSLRMLHKGTEIIGSGNLDYKVGTDAKDEVGQLSRAFDAMTQNLKKTTTSVENLNKEIAERKKAQELQIRLSAIIEATSDFVGFADAKDKHIIYMNKAGRKMVGVDEDEDITKLKLFDVHPEWTNKMFAEKILPAVVRDGTWVGECAFLNIRDRREIPVSMALFSHKASNGEVGVFSTISRDITERKQVTESIKRQTQELDTALKESLKSREILSSMLDDNNQIREKMKQSIVELETAHSRLKETQNQLIQAEKLSAMGRLASGVAHEVRNPLAIIMQSAEYLANKIPLEHKEMIQMIIDNIKRADAIVCTLVDFSRTSELKVIPEDINVILESSLVLIRHRIRQESIKIVKELKEGLPKVLVDKNKIEQVFVNILINAIQAMPNGGNIFIRTYTAEFEEPKGGVGRRIEDSFKLREKVVTIEVEDTGEGIKEENLGKIFEPFFTTKEPGAGTGLGLAVTSNIIAMHKGLIEIKSKAGAGTKVIIILKTERASYEQEKNIDCG